MTTFRNELRSARRAYAAARYPGDLAADVLPERERTGAASWRRLWIGLVTAALATAAVIVVALSRLPATRVAPPGAPQQIAAHPQPPDRPLAHGLAPDLPAVSLGSFPTRPAGAVLPSVGRLTPPALPGGLIVPALGGPSRMNSPAKPSTQESV